MNAVLITGVSSGIGHDATRFLIERGYTLFGSVRSDADRERLRAEFPDRFHPLLFDVTDRDAVLAAVEEVRRALGGANLRALVNNAGLVAPGPMMLLDDEAFEESLRVNLMGPRTVTNACLPLLGVPPGARTQQKLPPRPAKRPGRIINISSISGIINTPMNGAYCVSKHALESLGEVYRRELHLYGIDVVSIRSGPIESRIWEKNLGAMDEFAESDYGPMIGVTKSIMLEAQREALPAERISRLILRVIEARRPRLAYLVHRRRWAIVLMSRFTPARILDRLIRRNLS